MYDHIIDDYIEQVTEDMGTKQRRDVARELRTHILDSADALAAERKVQVDDFIVREVIDKMGPAEKIASMYPTGKTIMSHEHIKTLLSLTGVALAFLMVVVVLEVAAPGVINSALPGSDSSQSVLQIILSVVFALAIAIVVLAALFFGMYVYESMLGTTYEARLRAFERSMHNISSTLSAAVKIIVTLIWLILVNVFWSRVPFIQNFGDRANTVLVPLLSDKFGPFLLYINVLGIASIALALLFAFMAQKWLPTLIEAGISLCTALLFMWILAAFPFNSSLSAGVAIMIKVLLAVVVVGCLFAAAKQVWKALKLAMYEKSGKNSTV
jgi:magnesium-transporting ATPase (P-type)